MAAKDIGFVGLGIMGKPMVRNLIKAGYSLTVYDIIGTSIEEMADHGAKPASSAQEVATKTSVVITMVPDSADSEAAILGPQGVLEGTRSGSVVIDMSSIAPTTSQKIAVACEDKDVKFLDAPVSGGEPGAINGTLSIMVGGEKDVFDRHLNLLSAMGKSIVLCGNYGAGNTTKLANQIIVAGNIQAVCEALVLVKKAGLDPSTVFEAIKGGLAGSNVFNAKAPMIINGDFKPGFKVKLHQKDLQNALLTGKELGVPLPVTSLIQQMFVFLMNDGKSEWDHSSLVTFVENVSGTQVRSKP